MPAVILRRRKLGRGSARGIQQFSTNGLVQVRNWADDFPEGRLTVFRWGCTSNVPEGSVVVNEAKAIHWCSDKKQGRLDMQEAGVPVPETFPYDPEWMEGNEFLETTAEERAVRWVARPSRHAQGRNLFVGNFYQCQGWLDSFGGGYISRLINKVAEYRVFVCQNRVVWVARKTPGNPDQVAWNVAQGGRFDNVRWGDWPMPVIKAALAAAKVSGTDFCGVDVMVDAEGLPYVLEVNSAPSQTSEYRQRCVAKAFDYIIDNGKAHFPDVADGPRRTYKSYIHPAVRGNDG